MSEFKEGLYDQLITKRLRESFDRQTPRKVGKPDLLESNDGCGMGMRFTGGGPNQM
jgi:hypothetical protein